jgi:hypothetical protein
LLLAASTESSLAEHYRRAVRAASRHTYARRRRPASMDRQQVFALFMVLLMVFSSIAYAASLVF